MSVFADIRAFNLRMKNYRLLTISVFIIAVLAGIVMEHFLYRISTDAIGNIISEYGIAVSGSGKGASGLFADLLKTELKNYLLLILFSFTVVGIFGNLFLFFLTIYRYVFLMSALYRSGGGNADILCICAVLLCFLLLVPRFLYCIRLSYYSYLFCKEKGTKLYHCTKYQLQTELKIGIIMILYTMFGVVVESIIYTKLLGHIFL